MSAAMMSAFHPHQEHLAGMKIIAQHVLVV
jgi:hypothetical protein